MRFIATAVFGAFLSFAAPSFAATTVHSSQSSELRGDRLPLPSIDRPQILVDTKSLEVVIDRTAIAQLRTGQVVSLGIAGAGRYAYIVDQLINDPEVLEISGHLRDNPSKTITLGLRPEGLSGLIHTNDLIYALGYANKVQYFGEASSKWMAKELATETTSLQTMPVPLGGKPPVKGAEALDLNLALLSAMQPGEVTIMQLPGMGYTRVTFEEVRPGDGSATWVGHLKDFGDSFKAVLTYSPGGTEGTILTPAGDVNVSIGPDGQPYVFNPMLLGLVNGMQEGGSCAVLHEHSADNLISSDIMTTPSLAPSLASNATVAQASSTTGNIIDVLVYYTPGLMTAYGGLAGMTARVDALIALSNQAYNTGKLTYQIRRVGLELLNVADTTSNDSLLSQMYARSGPFVGLNAKRDQLGADLVSIIRPFYANIQGSCGVAYVSGANGSDASSYANLALSVVSDGSDKTGLSYHCDNVTFAHELGHNMGLMHDRATVTRQGGGTGAKPYAFGYVPASAKWGTIMSYTFPHLINFSNPQDSTCNGSELCGVSQSSPSSADNVAALSFTMPLIAAFRPSAVTTDVFTVSGVVTVNGAPVAGATLALSNVTGGSATSASCTASGTNGVYACTAPRGYAFQLTPSYKMPSGATITWTPVSATFSALAANQTSNFLGISSDLKYTLSGIVTVNGAATAGVALTVSGADAAKVVCPVTSSTGAYACSAPAGSSFTVAPSMSITTGSTLTWAPASAPVVKMTGNSTASFVGTLVLPKYTLSGVVSVNGVATPGVALTVSGTDAAKVICPVTSSTGAYACSAPAGSSFTIAPSMSIVTGSTLTWAPASASVVKMTGNSTASFVGTLVLPKYTLSGVVTVNGVATPGVALTVSGTDAAKVVCPVTSSTGAYSCSAPAGSSFTVAPSMSIVTGSTLTWAPASAPVVKMTGNSTASFVGTLVLPKRTLTIVTTMNGTKTISVMLNIAVTGAANQTSCAAAADITIKCQIPAGYRVTVTPVPTAVGMTFTPATQTLSALTTDSIMNFVGKTK